MTYLTMKGFNSTRIPATGISLNKSSITFDTAGQTNQITATVIPSGSTDTITWSSSNTNIATVNQNGLVTCASLGGTCTITATVNGHSANCSIVCILYPAGIYHNASQGLISLSSDGINWITMSDKNLGATQVYNDGNTLSEANCGKYYQWGNNYGFPFTGSVSKSSSTVNAGSYGPGNYYNSSSFRTTNPWDSSNNTNLWGADTGTNIAMRGPCSEGFHIPTYTEMYNLSEIMNSFGLKNSDGAKTYLKMPRGGYRHPTTSNITTQGGDSYYIINSVSNSTNCCSFRIGIYNTWGINNGVFFTQGNMLRPFKNDSIVPTSSRTVLYQ